MEVFIRDEETKWDISYSLADSNNSLDCKDHKPIIVKSLDQHDAEVRKPLEDEIERMGRLIDKLNNDYFKQKEISDYGMKELNNSIRQLKQERKNVIAELEEWADKKMCWTDDLEGTYTGNGYKMCQKKLQKKLSEMKGEKDE